MTELKPYVHLSTNQTVTCTYCCAGLSIGCFEIVTYVFALGNFVEEIRQVCICEDKYYLCNDEEKLLVKELTIAYVSSCFANRENFYCIPLILSLWCVHAMFYQSD